MKKIYFMFICLVSTLILCLQIPASAASAKKISPKNFKSTSTMYIASTKKLKVNITPASAKNSTTLYWTSSNKKVATVSQEGLVTAKAKGTTTITCCVKNNKKIKVTCKITVKPVLVKKITFSKKSISLNRTVSTTLKPSVLPTNATNKAVTYSSSNPKVASVNSSGKVTGIKAGTTTIKVTAKDGSKKSTSYKLTVKEPTLKKTQSKFIAHRGLSSKAPENTVTAFKLAAQKGFWGIETDVRKTRDGEFVLSHDESLSRTCNVNKKISNLTLEELKNIKIVSGNNYSTYKNDQEATTIPTLKEYLIVCKEYGVTPVIEIKMAYQNADVPDNQTMQDMVKSDMTKLYNETKSVMGNSNYVFIAFDLDTLVCMNTILDIEDKSNIALQHLTTKVSPSDIPVYLENSIAVSAKYQNLDNSTLKQLLESNIPVNIWTVNDSAWASNFISRGVSSVTTNNILWK